MKDQREQLIYWGGEQKKLSWFIEELELEAEYEANKKED